MTFLLLCPLQIGSSAELIELPGGDQVPGVGESFRKVYCFYKPLPAGPSQCISRWNPKFCLTDTLCLTLNFAQEDLVVLISEIDELPVRWGRERPTEGCFVCLGWKGSVFPLLECFSHPPISTRAAGFLFYLKRLRVNATPKEIVGQLCEDICVRILSRVVFIIAKGWKWPKCPSVGGEPSNLCWVDSYAAIKNDHTYKFTSTLTYMCPSSRQAGHEQVYMVWSHFLKMIAVWWYTCLERKNLKQMYGNIKKGWFLVNRNIGNIYLFILCS